MTISHVNDELYEMLRGELSNREMLTVNDHLRGCELCRDELVDVSLAHALLTSVSDILAPEFSGGRHGRDAEQSGFELPPLALNNSGPDALSSGVGGGHPTPLTNRSSRSFERGGYRRDRSRVVSARAAAGLPLAGSDLPIPEAARPSSAAFGEGAESANTSRRHHRRRPTAHRPVPTNGLRRTVRRSGIVAVALAVLVFAVILGVGSPSRPGPTNYGRILLTAELLPAGAAPNATGTVTVRSDGIVTVATTGLPSAPSGHYYEVWLVAQAASKNVPLGVLPPIGSGRFSFPTTLWSGRTGVAINLQANGARRNTSVEILSTLASAHTSASQPLPSHSSSPPTHQAGRPHTHHPRHSHPPKPHPRTSPSSSTPGSQSAQPPPVVRKLLRTKERHLSSGRELIVDTTRDSNAVNPGSRLCEDSQGDCSLRAAIEVANARRTAVTIRLPAGTYVLTLGALVATDPAGVTIDGTSAATTIITTKIAGDRVLVVQEAPGGPASTTGSVLSLSDLTVSGGSAPSTGALAGDGGAIAVVDTADVLELSHVTIADSHASVSGGGLFANGDVWATAARFESDSAGISGGGAEFARGEAAIGYSVFTSDTAGPGGTKAGEGGAVDDESAALVLVYSSFTNDSVTTGGLEARGGAVELAGPAWLAWDLFRQDRVGLASANVDGTEAGGALYVAAGPVTVQSSRFEDDQADGAKSRGGAIFAAATLNVIDSRFVDNAATASSTPASSTPANSTVSGGDGGAIFDAANLTLVDSWLVGNNADHDGGAVYASHAATITTSRFARSRAGGSGGAIYEDAPLTLTGCTLVHGLALLGGGIFVDGPLMASGDAVIDNLAIGEGAAGGGVFIVGRATSAAVQTVQVNRSTIAGNIAPVGAGIAEQTTAKRVTGASISRSDISDNDLASGAEQDCSVTDPGGRLFLASGGGNVVGDTSCDLRLPTDRQGPAAQGYWFAAAGGAVRACVSTLYGSRTDKKLGGAVVALAAAPGNDGYWEVTAAGDVDNFGSASWFGSATGLIGSASVTGFAATLDGGGYWLVTSDGRVFSFGDAINYGSAPRTHIVAMARSVDGRGYWLLAANGNVHAFGDAPIFKAQPAFAAAAIAATPDGGGYWVAATDGAVYTFGNAVSYGATFTSGVVALLVSSDGRGYLLVNNTGQVFAHGDASWSGSTRLSSIAAAAAT
jgi:hypothetical protein